MTISARSRPSSAPGSAGATRAFHLSYWSEAGTEKEALIGGLMEFLVPQKYFVVPDTGWSNWDLKISRGLCSRALGPRLQREPRRRKAAIAGALRDALFPLRVVSAAQLRRTDRVALILGWPADGGGDRRRRTDRLGGDGLPARRVWQTDAPHHRSGRQTGSGSFRSSRWPRSPLPIRAPRTV